MIINEKEIKSINNNMYLDELFKKSVFIDIETTGLSRKYSQIISITLLFHDCEKYKITQIFCQYKVDEPEALKFFKNIIKEKIYIITYNGNSFDLPFLKERAEKYNIDIDFNSFIKIDLYNCLIKFKNKIKTANLKLKTIEEYFNINRHDTLTGKDILTLYEAYRLEPRQEFSSLILEHNYEDVYNLPKVMNSIFTLYDEVLFLQNLAIPINYRDISIKNNLLQCKFNVITDICKDFISHNINYKMYLSIDKQVLEMVIPLNYFKDETIKEFCFINKDEYGINSFTAIRGIKRNLIPIKFNDKLYYDNIMRVIEKIVFENFK